MAKKEAPKKVKVEKKVPKYSLSVEVNGSVVEAKGETMLEAINALEKPVAYKTNMEFTATVGDKKAFHILPINMARRVFTNRAALELTASKLEKLLG